MPPLRSTPIRLPKRPTRTGAAWASVCCQTVVCNPLARRRAVDLATLRSEALLLPAPAARPRFILACATRVRPAETFDNPFVLTSPQLRGLVCFWRTLSYATDSEIGSKSDHSKTKHDSHRCRSRLLLGPLAIGAIGTRSNARRVRAGHRPDERGG